MEDRARAPGARDPDAGFTLIELLVVVIIIGILAAIAIPVFLNQRSRAADASAESDLRNLAQFEEAYFAGNDSYGTIASLVADGEQFHPSPGVTVTVVSYDAVTGYCLSAQHYSSTITWWYDSQAGGLQPRGTATCPVTTSGTAGDSVTG